MAEKEQIKEFSIDLFREIMYLYFNKVVDPWVYQYNLEQQYINNGKRKG